MRSLFVFSCLGFIACAAPTTVVQNNVGAAQQEKSTANMVKSFATMTPPSGAHAMGMQSNPRAGTATVPIVNVEVYTFTANVDDDAAAETLYWANDGDSVYVWGTIDLECVDESDTPTGETGTAGFVYEADPGGYGWLVGTDSCGYSTLFGCSDDGTGETCGGCDWDESVIVCAAD